MRSIPKFRGKFKCSDWIEFSGDIGIIRHTVLRQVSNPMENFEISTKTLMEFFN